MRLLAMGAMALVPAALWAQDPTKPVQPLHFDLSRPLCQQTQLSPDLLGALTPPSAAVLGVPAAVQVTLPAMGGLAPVRVGAPGGVPGGLAPVRIGGGPGGPAGIAPVAALGGLGAVAVTTRVPSPMQTGPAAVALDSAASETIGLGGLAGRMASALARLEAHDTDGSVRQVLDAMPIDQVRAAMVQTDPWTDAGRAVRDGLVESLLRTGKVALGEVARAPWCVKPFAQYLSSRADARCERLFDDLLAAREQTPAQGWVQEVYDLATFYRMAGRYADAIGTWRRGLRCTTDPATQADYQVEAAGDLLSMGQGAEGVACAESAHEAALRAKSTWLAAMALYSASRWLSWHGEHDRAMALAARPTGAAEASAEGFALRFASGMACWLRGDFASASASFRAALVVAGEVPDAIRQRRLTAEADSARSALALLDELGQRTARTTGPERLVLLRNGSGQPEGSVWIESLRPGALAVDIAEHTLRVATPGEWQRQGLLFRRAVNVVASPEARDGVMRISLDGRVLSDMPVHVADRTAVVVSPDRVFLPASKGSGRGLAVCRVSCQQACRIVSVTASDPAHVVCETDERKAEEHIIRIRADLAADAPAELTGELTISTDLPVAQRIQVPYVVLSAP